MVKNPPANTGDVGSIPESVSKGKDPLEKEVAIHSSFLAWRILEEPGGLQSVGLQKSRT